MTELPELPDQLPEDPEARLALIGAVLTARVAAALPAYLEAVALRIVDVWGRLDDAARADCRAQIRAATPDEVRSVTAALTALLAMPAIEQRETPLELVRRAVAMPTAVLESFGIPAIERDGFEETNAPDDIYGLAPHALSDLGDAALGPIQLAWGLAKHHAIRATSA